MQTGPAVIHNAERGRFEVHLEHQMAELTYQISGDVMTFMHTGVPVELEGRGIGSLLAGAGLKYAREHNLKVGSFCWFIDKYMERHPSE